MLYTNIVQGISSYCSMLSVWCHILNSNEVSCEGQLTRKMEVFRSIRSSAELKFHWISLDYGYSILDFLHACVYALMHVCLCMQSLK